MPDFTRAWDETFPPDTQPANQLGVDIRQLKADARQRLTLSGNDADKPTNSIAAEAGLLYFAVDSSKIYRWNGTGWDDVTKNFTSGLIHSDNNAALNIPANYLQLGSLIQLDAYLAPVAPQVSNLGFNIGGFTFTSGLISFAGGDFAWVHAEVSVISIVGTASQFLGIGWGRASLAAGSVDFKLVVGGVFPDPTGIIPVIAVSGTLSAKVFR